MNAAYFKGSNCTFMELKFAFNEYKDGDIKF